ncbi:MAG: hypothetical protein ACE5K8_03990 [Candidatus Zixiibacteriota bacterium]
MSYTNIELVKHHLVSDFPAQERIQDQTVVLEGGDYVTFFNGAVEESSVTIKSIQSNELTRATVTLGSGRTSLASSPLVRSSVVVASDSSLGTIYTENVDYIIDYAEADLIIKSGGSLSAGQTVTVWFLTYFVYAVGSDYQVDADSGRLKRLGSGAIASGETVHLDYSPVYKSFNEEMLNNAVLEANGLIEKEVDPDGQFGADPVLQASATYRALEIICRAAAARELSSLRGEDRTAVAWMKLAEAYAERSDRLLRLFRPPYTGPTAPVHS